MPTAQRFEASDRLSDAVAVDPLAVGFIGVAYVRNAKPVIVEDRGEPFVASPTTVSTEDYPLARRLYLYTTASTSDTVRRFVDFALSDDGQAAVRAAGLVDLRPTCEASTSQCARCTPAYRLATAGACRFNVNFRFEGKTTELDTRGLRDLQRLIATLAKPEYAGKSLVLVGFSDASGGPVASLTRSNDPARSIADQLRARGLRLRGTHGFGGDSKRRSARSTAASAARTRIFTRRSIIRSERVGTSDSRPTHARHVRRARGAPMTTLRWLLLSLSIPCVALAACSGDDNALPVPGVDGGLDGAARDATSSIDGSPDGAAVDASDSGVDAVADGGVVQVQILAFNDFHGNLRPPSPSNAVVVVKQGDPAIGDAGSPRATDAGVVDGGALNVQLFAGGASYFAAHVKRLRSVNPNTLLVSAGDMTGASPLISSSYDDEPTIEVMNTIGVDSNGVGNHEFDHGPSELLRLQYGGCNAADHTDAGGSCVADTTFPGATFSYLAANVDVSTTKTIFPAYAIKTIGGARVALVGMTLKATPSIVSASGTAGLTFLDEIDTVNALVPTLKQQNVDAIVVLVHQGGSQLGTYDECVGFTATAPTGTKDIATITDALDPAIDVVVSAHTHAAYNCVRANGRLLTSAASYGRILTQIALGIDTTTHKVVSKRAKNVVVTRDIAPDPTVEALVQRYAADIAPIAERRVGQISADIARLTGPNGESPLGDVAADALLAATGADVAFTNIGGLRDSLLYKQYYSEGDGIVTFEKAQAVMPFKNKVEILRCTGAQIIAGIQQNVYVQPGGATKLLQVSSGFAFSWNAANADANGQNAAVASSFTINGAAVDPLATYNVGITDFVGNGGDGYVAFRQCALQSLVGIDLDAFAAYLGAHQPLAPPSANRITKL